MKTLFKRTFSTISLQRKFLLFIVVTLSLIFAGSGIFIHKLVNDTFMESERRHVAIISESLSSKVGVWYFINKDDKNFQMKWFLKKMLISYNLEYIAFKDKNGKLVSEISAPEYIPSDAYNLSHEIIVLSPEGGRSHTEIGKLKIAYGHHLLKELSVKYYMVGTLLFILLGIYLYFEMRLLKELLTPLRKIAAEIKGYMPGDKLSFEAFNKVKDDVIYEIVNGFLHMQQNIDDAMKRREIEEENNRIKDAILMKQSRFIEMGTMINNIAHQWKQPLNIIELCITDLTIKSLMGKIDLQHQQKLFDDMHIQVAFMSNTIDIFKNFLNEDQNEKSREIFSLKKAIEDTMKLLGSTLEKKKILTSFTLDESACVYGSISELEQVILILFNNAIDAKSTKISVECIAEKEGNVIKIYDNGGGFAPNTIDKIFDAYYTTKHQSQGTGLGLFIARMIIEMKFEGSIEAQNIKNGAQFVIKFPYPNTSIIR